MDRKDRQYTTAALHGLWSHGLLAVLLMLAVCMGGCQTVKPGDDVLDRLYSRSMADPSNISLLEYELPLETSTMARWLEQSLDQEYRLTYQAFVLTEPKSMNWTSLEPRAMQYMEHELGAKRLRHAGKDADTYRILFWRLSRPTPRYIALVMSQGPLPDNEERKLAGYVDLPAHEERELVGYFELVPAHKTINLGNVLAHLQDRSMPDPQNRPVSARDLPEEKAAMARWLEQYSRGKYGVIDQRFVMTRPGFTEWAALQSHVVQYLYRELGATPIGQEWKEEEWKEIDAYLVSFWRVDQGTPRYFAVVMTDEPLPGPEERSLVGYFELIPSAE